MMVFSRLLIGAAALTMATASVAAQQHKTVKAKLQQVGGQVTIAGTVVPFKEVTISARVPGEVKFLAGQEGDKFTKGTKLVTVDDDDLQAKRRSAVAQVLAAQAALNNANAQYTTELINPSINRGQNRTSGFGMPQMFDNLFTRPFAQSMGQAKPGVQRYADVQRQINAVNQARSAMMTARANLRAIDVMLKDTVLTAPFDGVIISKMVEVGDSVQPGKPMLKFAYVKFLRIRSEVPVRLVSALKKGMFVPARIEVGGGVNVRARVSQIFPIADATRHTVSVKFDLPKGVPGGPGMYAELRIPDPTSQITRLPVIPETAVLRNSSLPSVRILVNGKVTTRLVRLGERDGKGNVTILSGLKGGEDVIVREQGS